MALPIIVRIGGQLLKTLLIRGSAAQGGKLAASAAKGLKWSKKAYRAMRTVSDATKPEFYINKARKLLVNEGYEAYLDAFDTAYKTYSVLKNPRGAIASQSARIIENLTNGTIKRGDVNAARVTLRVLKDVDRALGGAQQDYKRRIRESKKDFEALVKQRRAEGFNIPTAEVKKLRKWYKNAGLTESSARKARQLAGKYKDIMSLETKTRAEITDRDTATNRRRVGAAMQADMKFHFTDREGEAEMLFRDLLYDGRKPSGLAQKIADRYYEATGEKIHPSQMMLRMREMSEYVTPEELGDAIFKTNASTRGELFKRLRDPSTPLTQAERLQEIERRRIVGFNRFKADMARLGFNDVTQDMYDAMERIHRHPAWQKWQAQRYKLPYDRAAYARLARINASKDFNLQEYAMLLDATGSIELANERYSYSHPEVADAVFS